jgi:hypothetical protein
VLHHSLRAHRVERPIVERERQCVANVKPDRQVAPSLASPRDQRLDTSTPVTCTFSPTSSTRVSAHLAEATPDVEDRQPSRTSKKLVAHAPRLRCTIGRKCDVPRRLLQSCP